MGVWYIEGILTLFVMIGTLIIVWGVRRFNLSPQVLAVTFTITATCWIALIVATIGLTVRTLVLSNI